MVENVLTVGAPNIPEKACFKLIGYPDWWNDFQAQKKRDDVAIAESTSHAAVANAKPQLSFLSQLKLPNDPTPPHNQGNCGHVLLSSTPHDDDVWIIDSRAIDHMTFDSNDFSHITQPRPCISNANGVTYPVIGAGTVIISHFFTLSHILLVHSLSNILMSASQVTTNLNCAVLIYPIFCFL